MGKKIVVIGIAGTVLDNHCGGDRWDRFRPTVSIGMHEDLLVSRLELIVRPGYEAMERAIVSDFRVVSPETTVNVHKIDFPDPWDFEQVYSALLDFAKSLRFDTAREDYLVHITTGTHVMQICLFLLVESRIIPGRILQTWNGGRRGPVGQYVVIDLDLSKYDKLAGRFAEARREAVHVLKDGIPTRNEGYNRLIEEIAAVSMHSDDPILITGPSGVGKTRLARLVYKWKRENGRVSGDLIEVNCATIRGEGAMSALFGHVKGAYTGAISDREGLLSKADGGLLFLDEVGELGLDEQAMLLRAIEEKRFYPLGSDEERASNFQLICGTNRNLQQMVEQGAFREDLLARINLWSFRLMGLSERPEDIEPNLDYELERVSEQEGKMVRMSAEARELFLKAAMAPGAAWTGNFRDLAGAVRRMAVLSEGGSITPVVARGELERLKSRWGGLARGSTQGDAAPLCQRILGAQAEELDPFDLVQLEYVLATCVKSKSLSEAGRALFSCSMKKKKSSNDSDRLRKYLEKFGLSFASVKEAAAR